MDKKARDRLKGRIMALLQRAQLREGEDEARENEARACAFQLIQLARKHGVKIKFVLPAVDEAPVPPPGPGRPQASNHRVYVDFININFSPYADVHDPVVDVFRNDFEARLRRTARAERPDGWFLVPSGSAGQCKCCRGSYTSADNVWVNVRNGVTGGGPLHEGCIDRFIAGRPSAAVHAERDGAYLIDALTPGTCGSCGRAFTKGARVWFKQGAGVGHERCGLPDDARDRRRAEVWTDPFKSSSDDIFREFFSGRARKNW